MSLENPSGYKAPAAVLSYPGLAQSFDITEDIIARHQADHFSWGGAMLRDAGPMGARSRVGYGFPEAQRTPEFFTPAPYNDYSVLVTCSTRKHSMMSPCRMSS